MILSIFLCDYWAYVYFLKGKMFKTQFLKCVLSSSYVPNISQMLGIQGGVKRKLCEKKEKKVFSHETYCLVKEIITQNSLYNPNRCY